MPNVLVRGHMRFDNNEKKIELLSKIQNLESEIINLRSQLNVYQTFEDNFEYNTDNTNQISEDKDIITIIRNFEKKSTKYLPHSSKYIDNNRVTKVDELTHIQNNILNMIAKARYKYPTITIKDILNHN